MEPFKQKSKHHAEKSHVEGEMLSALDDLVNKNWDSNALKIKIQELMKQRFCIEQQIYKLTESPLTSQNTITRMKSKRKSRLIRSNLN